MLKGMYPELKKIYDEVMSIEMGPCVKGQVNENANRVLALRNQYEKAMKVIDEANLSYNEIKENQNTHQKIINMRTEIDTKFKGYLIEYKKVNNN